MTLLVGSFWGMQLSSSVIMYEGIVTVGGNWSSNMENPVRLSGALFDVGLGNSTSCVSFSTLPCCQSSPTPLSWMVMLSSSSARLWGAIFDVGLSKSTSGVSSIPRSLCSSASSSCYCSPSPSTEEISCSSSATGSSSHPSVSFS